MDRPSLVLAISKLAMVGGEAGFTVEQMIELLDAGITVGGLLELISWRLEKAQACAASRISPNWLM